MQSDATTPAEYTVAIQRIQAVVDMGRRRGWDVDEILEIAGIAPELLVEGRSRVTISQAADLIMYLWRVTDDELLGLGAQPVPRGTFRMVCFGLLNAPDLRTAARRFETFNRSLPGIPPLRLTQDGETARLSFDLSAIREPVDAVIDTLLTITHQFIGWAIRHRVPLRRVELPYPPIPGVDDYHLIFGAPAEFSTPSAALVFDAAVLSAPIVRDDEELTAFLRDAPARMLGRPGYPVSLAGQVRRRLERGLGGAWPGVEDIAAELAMSPQTLRRRLREEHTSTREIRENILRDAAIASLVRGEETVTALSRRLGFSEPSAFSRAFRRWTGSPPGSYRH